MVSAKIRLRCPPANESAAAKTTIMAPRAFPVTVLSQKKRTAIGKLAESRKASSVARCEALSTTAPAHIPPITKVRKICPREGINENKIAPPRPQVKPAASEPQTASNDQ